MHEYTSIRGFIFEGAMLMTMYRLHVLLYQLQCGTPLHCAAKGGHATCVEHLLSTPGIDVNIKNGVSWSTECHRVIQCVVV